MFLIKYYQDNDTVPIPKVRDIKETKYKDVDMLEYDIYKGWQEHPLLQ